MTLKRLSIRTLKITAFILGGILVLMTAFHIWFINHAGQLLEDMVSAQSNGKLKLKIDRFKFDWFTYRMDLRKANFYSADTGAATSYQFNVARIKVKVQEILPLILEKRILIDSIQLINPDIVVTRLRSLKDSTDESDTSMSIPQEMGRIYNSIQDALRVLQVDRFQIDKGRFSLVNKIRPKEPPVVITDINFHLENLQVDTTEKENKEKILFSDNVALHTSNQNIVFPDGRHRLSFKNFRINIMNRLAEFDSCTVMATKGDSTNNSFSIFFDKLQMTNIDFSTLYHDEIIKADSVYCINPRFKLDVDITRRSDAGKSIPRLDELIRQLTGNMHLAFVVVENGSFDINTTRDGQLSSFTSEKNNFELQGLQIRKYGPKPLTVEKFVMAIRNYENFLRDSSYAMQFDSIHINDNRISLSNFKFQDLENGRPVNTLSMPQFELQGLSWDDLVFNKRLAANKVNLYRPVINYTVAQKKYKSKDIFQTLADIGNFMQLENLTINDGQVNLFFKNNIQLKLENANINVLGRRLVDSRKISNIQNSVTALYFKKGVFKMGQLVADLADVNFTGSPANHLQAGTIRIKNKNELDVLVKDASIHSMIINDDLQHTRIGGIDWKQADIRLFTSPKQNKANSTVFKLSGIKGANTQVSIEDSSRKLSVYLKNIQVDDLSTGDGNKLLLAGLAATGNKLSISHGNEKLQVGQFNLADKRASVLEDILYLKKTDTDSLRVIIPSIRTTPDINTIIDGKLYAGDVHIVNPLITSYVVKQLASQTKEIKKWPETKIGSLVLEGPVLDFSKRTENGMSSLKWNGDGKVFELTNLFINHQSSPEISAAALKLSLHKFSYSTPKGRTIDAGKGRLEADIEKIRLQQNDVGAWDWSGFIRSLGASNITADSLGKNAGRLFIEKGKLKNLSINSANLFSLHEMLKSNISSRLQEITGSYQNSKSRFDWYNTTYDKSTRYFTMDSFTYHPMASRDEFIQNAAYQADYIVAKTGAIAIGPFDIDRYGKDSVFEMGVVTINEASFSSYRDKRKPQEPGVIRLLPANLIKKIPVRLLVDTLNLKNAHVEYEEVNEKTGVPGKITVGDLNGTVTQIRNYNLGNRDSLQLKATGYIENKLHTHLNVKESYTDPLGGFVMTVKMDSTDLTVLNPVLKPLALAELKSGYLDSMYMYVVGREEMAYGKIKMAYHDLKVRIIAKDEKKSVFRGVITFFANSMVKNKNTEKLGTVFFKRLRNRSAVNYLVKITLSGVSSSIGLKKNDRLARKNKQQTIHRSFKIVKPG
ncbi:DUF748 domain-containing protein [Terrimonas pollutisoli]|uniref:DUF748 domain-containing protein n=1 Tax=Terrimonas pollutisoli TaxID=3034147 RepID=UPI0023EB5A06|nr:DUF748 domain-containing protein [Terrimonas sp. H1YJ31]